MGSHFGSSMAKSLLGHSRAMETAKRRVRSAERRMACIQAKLRELDEEIAVLRELAARVKEREHAKQAKQAKAKAKAKEKENERRKKGRQEQQGAKKQLRVNGRQ